MSSGGVNTTTGGRINNNGISAIPSTSRRVVQSLKEIVNYPDLEIYAMLKECNMDPNEAVHRLLSQDTFHEVKSKKEKRKEIKEISEIRPRVVSSTSSRGVRGGANRDAARGISAQFISTKPGALRVKPVYRKENGANAFMGSSTSASGILGNNSNQPYSPYRSDTVNVDNRAPSVGSGDIISSSSQPITGYQSAWVGVPGQLSMVEIVKRGRPQPKAPTRPIPATDHSCSKRNELAPNASYHSVEDPHVTAPLPTELNHDFPSLSDPPLKVSETIKERGDAASKHASHDEWPLAEQSPSESDDLVSANDEAYGKPSLVSNVRADQHRSSQADEFRITKEDLSVENLEYTGSDPSSCRHISDDGTGGASHFDNDSFNNINSYQPHVHASDHQEAVQSAPTDLYQLNLEKEQPTEAKLAVKIPNHLQISNADCMGLSFGSFGSGISATYPGAFASKSHEITSEKEVSAQPDASSISHSEIINPEYSGDEQFRSTSDGNVDPRIDTGTVDYDTPSQPEVLKQEASENIRGHNYSYATSSPGYGYENSIQPNSAFSYAYSNAQMPNAVPFPNMMHPFTNSSLPSMDHSAVRESDVQPSSFPETQSMPTKYSNTVSSVSGPTISIPKTLAAGAFNSHPAQQNLTGASIAAPPHLLNSYPPMGQFPFYSMLPASYPYLPSYQQAYGNNSTYPQASGGIKYTVPSFKNGVPASNFAPSAANVSGHGGFGGSNIPGNFQLSQSTNSTSSIPRYEDLPTSPYKDNSQCLPTQQNDNLALWLQQGAGSRTVATVPASPYYSFQGQNQQHSGFRQDQHQPSQHYSSLGYPNFYLSQTGVAQDQQQLQTQNDGSLGGSQVQQAKQSKQIWPHPY